MKSESEEKASGAPAAGKLCEVCGREVADTYVSPPAGVCAIRWPSSEMEHWRLGYGLRGRALAEAEKAARLREAELIDELTELNETASAAARAAEERAAQAERLLREAHSWMTNSDCWEMGAAMRHQAELVKRIETALQEAAPKGRAPEAPPDPKSEIP